MELNTPIAITFLSYLAVLMAIGLVAWRKTQTASDFFLGGRNLSPTVSALSAGASDMSGWVLLGLPGYAYLSGLEATWISLGLCIGVALNWILSAKRLRILTQRLDVVTLPDYFHRRFTPSNSLLRVFSSLFILLFFLFYVSSGLIGGGKLFVAVFGLGYQSAVITGAIVIITYTLIGGFLAVSWTDVFQGLLMTLALVVVPVMVISQLGGVESFINSAQAANPDLLDVFTDNTGGSLSAIALVSLLGWGLGYFGQPHILARFKALRSPSMVTSAASIGISWSVLVYFAAILIGLGGQVFLAAPLDDSEKVFMVLVGTLFHPVIAGFLLAAILAAIMSTVDSQLLVCSSTLAEDLYPTFTGKNLDDRQRIGIARVSVLVLAIIATAIAMDESSKVLDVVAYAWGGLGAALGPATLLSLYWKRMNWQGALAGVLVGGVTVILWKQLEGGWFDVYELVPGFFFSLLAIVVVSKLTATPEDNIEGLVADLKNYQP